MTRAAKVRERYENVTDKLFSDRAAFAEYLKFSGRFFKLPAEQTMIIFDSNPNAQLVTDYDTWQQIGAYSSKANAEAHAEKLRKQSKNVAVE